MNDEKLQQMAAQIRKGLDRGFSGSYILHQLTKRGYPRRQLEHALHIATMSPEQAHATELVHEKIPSPVKEEPVQYHEISYHGRTHNEEKKSFSIFRDPASFILVVILCFLFFALGVMVDKLLLAL